METSAAATQNSRRQRLSFLMPPVLTFKLPVKPITIEAFGILCSARSSASSSSPCRTVFSPIELPPLENVPPGFRQADNIESEYGFNENGEKKKRVMVREENNRQLLREYGYSEPGVFKCLRCDGATATKVEDVFIVSIEHKCEPIPLQNYKEEQKEFEAIYKMLNASSTMPSGSAVRYSFGSSYNRQSNGSGQRGTKRMGSGYTVEDDGAKRARDSNGQSSTTFSGSKNFNMNNSKASTSQLLETTYNSVGTIQRFQPPNMNNILTRAVKFYKPSSLILETLCQRVGIVYSDQASQFWKNIKITEFSSKSNPNKICSVANKMNSGFSAISLLLTGTEASALKIKEKMNSYFIVIHKILGQYLGQDLSSLDHPLVRRSLIQEAATELHFECFVHLLKCRLGIFADGRWLRYGNWDGPNAETPIFLLEMKNNIFFPVLSLTL